MLYGMFEHSLDSKKRITIPARHREALGAVCILMKGSLGNLTLYPLAKWEEMVRAINERPLEEQNELRDCVFAVSAEVVPDSQGRIILPASHISYAGINSDVVIIGSDFYEAIWSKEVWEARNADKAEEQRAKLRSIGF